jgi:hypothetical protein
MKKKWRGKKKMEGFLKKLHTKHSWDIFARECIGRVGNKEACLTDSTITHHNTLD